MAWSNIQPAATTTTNLTVSSEAISYADVSYHDKLWSDIPFPAGIQSWYWGHAVFGSYSAIWNNTRLFDGTLGDSTFVSKDGVALSASCVNKSVTTTTYGTNQTYPPVPGILVPDGMIARFDLGNGTFFVANATTDVTINLSGSTSSFFFNGPVRGGIEGGEQLKGSLSFRLWGFKQVVSFNFESGYLTLNLN